MCVTFHWCGIWWKSSCPYQYHGANIWEIEYECLPLTFQLQIKVCLECAICNNVKFYCKYSQNQHEEDCKHLYFPPISRADFIVPTVKTLCDRKTRTENKILVKKHNQNRKEWVENWNSFKNTKHIQNGFPKILPIFCTFSNFKFHIYLSNLPQYQSIGTKYKH